MNRGVARLFATVAASIAFASALPAAAQNRIYYVDFDSGNDAADGLSPATAWKHAPGDALGTDNPKKLKLQPGDHVRFKGGVRYRGQLSPKAPGTEENPIVYDGSSWGSTRAIIDGSTALSGVRPCASATDCLGSTQWKNLWRADLPAGSSWSDYLFVNDQVFQLGQYPSLSKLDADNPHQYLVIPKAELARLNAGRINHALPAGFDKGTPLLALWVQPNLIGLAEGIRVSTGGVDFVGAKWVGANFNPYTNRDEYFSLMNLPDQVNRPGLFASSPKDGVAIFWPMPAGVRAVAGQAPAPAVSIGSHRMGITISATTNFVIRGFSFTNFAGIPGNYSSGSAIYGWGAATGLVIADNSIRSVVNIGGRSVISLLGSQNLRIERNQISDTPWTRGIVLDNSIGPSVIRCNTLTETGSTAIRLLNVANSEVVGNMVSRVKSIHGNGITAYLDIRNVRISGNVVTDTARPVTLQGIGSGTPYFSEGTPGTLVTDNVLMGGDGINGAITSYGTTPNLVIRNNFLHALPNALKVSGTETGLVATGNQLVGGLLQPKASQLLSPVGNTFHESDGNGSLLIRQMQRAKPPAGYCG